MGAATAILVGAHADLTFASIVLLLAVAGDAVLGYAPGLAAAISSTAMLTYYFTPPIHSFGIDQPDEILALIAFVAVSLLVGATIARLNELRRHAEVSAREAALRVGLAEELRQGVPVATVLQHLAHELDELFELSQCAVVEASDAGTGIRTGGPGEVVIATPPLAIRLVPTRVLQPDEIKTITGVAGSVATLLELERVDAAARDERMQGELDRSRAGFLTAVTHDLRTPLATIKAASAALLAVDSRLDATDRRELLEDTYAEAARLEGLVNKVLELIRIRTGALTPELVAVTAADLVRIAVDRLGPTLRMRTISFDFDPELPDLRVDALLMEHVLVNLLENAAMHDPSGGAIDVRGAVHGPRFELRLLDHGPGVPAADHERIFDEFVRRRAATDGPGTGLGLAIVRALTVANGGRVWCEDTPGGGATFVLELPVADDEEVVAP